MADTSGSAGEVRVRLALEVGDLKNQIRTAERTVGAGEGIPLKVRIDDAAVQTINGQLNGKKGIGSQLQPILLPAGLDTGERSVKQINTDIKTLAKNVENIKIKAAIVMSDHDRATIVTLAALGRKVVAAGSSGAAGTTPAKAMGGHVQQARPVWVGERGTELFVPGRSGTVIPNHELRRFHAGGRAQPGDPNVWIPEGHKHNIRPPSATARSMAERYGRPLPPQPYVGDYWQHPQTGVWYPTNVKTQKEADRWSQLGRTRPLRKHESATLEGKALQAWEERSAPQSLYPKGWSEPWVATVVPGPKVTRNSYELRQRAHRRRATAEDPNVRALAAEDEFIDVGRGGYNKERKRYGRKIVMSPRAGSPFNPSRRDAHLDPFYSVGSVSDNPYAGRGWLAGAWTDEQLARAVRGGYGPEEWAAFSAEERVDRERANRALHELQQSQVSSTARSGVYPSSRDEELPIGMWGPAGAAVAGGQPLGWTEEEVARKTVRHMAEVERTLSRESTAGTARRGEQPMQMRTPWGREYRPWDAYEGPVSQSQFAGGMPELPLGEGRPGEVYGRTLRDPRRYRHPYRPLRRKVTIGDAARARSGQNLAYSHISARPQTRGLDPRAADEDYSESVAAVEPMGYIMGSSVVGRDEFEGQSPEERRHARHVAPAKEIIYRVTAGGYGEAEGAEARALREAREAADAGALDAARSVFKEFDLARRYPGVYRVQSQTLNEFVPGLGNVAEELAKLDAIRRGLRIDDILANNPAADLPPSFVEQATRTRDMLYGMRREWEERWGSSDGGYSQNFYDLSPDQQQSLIEAEQQVGVHVSSADRWRYEQKEGAKRRAAAGRPTKRSRQSKALIRERQYKHDPLGGYMPMTSNEAAQIELGSSKVLKRVQARGLAEGLAAAERDDNDVLRLMGVLSPQAQVMRDYQGEVFEQVETMQAGVERSMLEPLLARKEAELKKDPQNTVIKAYVEHLRLRLRAAGDILNAQQTRAMGGPVEKGGLFDRVMSARIQRAMNEGRTDKSQKLQKQLEQARGGWGGKDIPRGFLGLVIPALSAIGRSIGSVGQAANIGAMAMGEGEELEGYFGGGTIAARQLAPNQAAGHLPELANVPGAVLVGEHGPEVVIPGASGGIVFPNHWGGDPRSIPTRHSGGSLGRHSHRVNDLGQDVYGPDARGRWRLVTEGNLAPYARAPQAGALTPGEYTRRIGQAQQTGRLGLDVSGTAGSAASGAFQFRPRNVAQRLGPPPPEIAAQQAQFSAAMQPAMDSLWATLGSSIGGAGQQASAQQAGQQAGQQGGQQQLGSFWQGFAQAVNKGAQQAQNNAKAQAAQAAQQQANGPFLNQLNQWMGMPGVAGAQPVNPGAAAVGVQGGTPQQYTAAMKSREDTAMARSVTGRSYQDEITEIRTGISEQLSLTPVRALSVSLGQIAQTAIGGRAGILARAGVARTKSDEASRQSNMLDRERENIASLQYNRQRAIAIQGPGWVGSQADKDILSAIEDSKKAEKVQEKTAAKAVDQAKLAEKAISTRSQRIRTQALGVGGIVGGTMLFSNAMKMAQGAMAGIEQVAGDMVDSMTGFTRTTNQVSDQMGKAVQAGGTGGRAEMASQMARIGYSGATPELTRRAQLLAGAQNLQSIQDVIRTEQNLGERNRLQGVTTGFNNGPLAGVPVLGDLFGWIGQQQSYTERSLGTVKWPTDQALVTDQVAAAAPGVEAYGGFSEPAAPLRDAIVALTKQQGLEPKQGITLTDQALRNELILGSGIEGEAATEMIDLWRKGTMNMSTLATGQGGGPVADAKYAEDLLVAQANLATLTAATNESITRINPALGRFEKTSDEAAQNLLETVAQGVSGAEAWGTMMNKAGYGLSLPSGKAVTQEDLVAAIEAAVKGMAQQSYTQNLEAQQVALQAQMRSMERARQFQTEMVPAHYTRQLLQQPLAAPTTGLMPMFGGAPSGILGGAFPQAGMMKGYVSQITDIQDQLKQTFEEGLPRLSEISGVSEADLRTMQEYAQVTQDMRDDAANLQMGMEQEQYNEQLRISKRGLGDLVGLAGKLGGAYRVITGFNEEGEAITSTQLAQATEYGQLQRAQIMDSRQLTQIQQARSQRELNLQLALSRMQAPGQTPQERAARQREAELIAREQQTELNINKRSTQRGYRMQDIEIGRQLDDALRAQGLSESQRKISFDIQGMSSVANARDQLHQLKLSVLDIGTQFGEQVQSAFNTAQASAEAASGQFLKLQTTQARKTFDAVITEVERAYDVVIPTYQTRQERREQREADEDRNGMGPQRAAGGIFSANGATSFIAGEAGSESVIVIRNPKLGLTSGGPAGRSGGSSNINVVINNPQVRNQEDIDKLARMVVRKLHDEARTLGIA